MTPRKYPKVAKAPQDPVAVTKQKLESINEALGLHPDSDTNFAEEVSRLRQESRDQFHANTKLTAKLAEYQDGIVALLTAGEVMAEALNRSKVRPHILERWYSVIAAIRNIPA